MITYFVQEPSKNSGIIGLIIKCNADDVSVMWQSGYVGRYPYNFIHDIKEYQNLYEVI